MLNYLYGMLYTVVEAAIFAAGLDPHLGFLHTDMHNRPTLAFDMIEPFRPWIDRLLLEQCLQRNLEKHHFTKNEEGYFISKRGKSFIIPLFNAYLLEKRVFEGKTLTHKSHIYRFVGLLSKHLKKINFQNPK